MAQARDGTQSAVPFEEGDDPLFGEPTLRQIFLFECGEQYGWMSIEGVSRWWCSEMCSVEGEIRSGTA